MPLIEVLILIVFVVGLLAPIVVVVIAKRAERRHPPIGRFIDIDGLRLHYLERGDADAPPVVLFHGNGAMIQDLAGSGLIDLLARRYRVICFDRPGFGYSRRSRRRLMTPEAQAVVFEAALWRLGVRDPVVFGHSWGTLVALALALRASQSQSSPKGLVLAAGYYFPTFRPDVWVVSGPAIPIIGDIICYTISPLLGWLLARPMVRRLFAPDDVPQSFQDQFPLAIALRPSQLRTTAEESALMIPAARRLKTRYRNLTCPIAIFSATGDTMVEPEQGPRLYRAIAGATLRIVKTGHMLHYAIPGEIAGAIGAMAGPVQRISSPELAPTVYAGESPSRTHSPG
jgi:pimeloyl-ACP methyl ester carboxylesterase